MAQSGRPSFGSLSGEPENAMARPILMMTETDHLEKRLEDLERRHDKTCDAFAGLVSVIMAAAAVSWLDPKPLITWVLDFAVACFVLRRLTQWLLEG